jgi:hypothetical protein
MRCCGHLCLHHAPLVAATMSVPHTPLPLHAPTTSVAWSVSSHSNCEMVIVPFPNDTCGVVDTCACSMLCCERKLRDTDVMYLELFSHSLIHPLYIYVMDGEWVRRFSRGGPGDVSTRWLPAKQSTRQLSAVDKWSLIFVL